MTRLMPTKTGVALSGVAEGSVSWTENVAAAPTPTVAPKNKSTTMMITKSTRPIANIRSRLPRVRAMLRFMLAKIPGCSTMATGMAAQKRIPRIAATRKLTGTLKAMKAASIKVGMSATNTPATK